MSDAVAPGVAIPDSTEYGSHMGMRVGNVGPILSQVGPMWEKYGQNGLICPYGINMGPVRAFMEIHPDLDTCVMIEPRVVTHVFKLFWLYAQFRNFPHFNSCWAHVGTIWENLGDKKGVQIIGKKAFSQKYFNFN